MKLKIKTAGLVAITMGTFILLLFLFIRPLILDDAQEMDKASLDIDSDRVQAYINGKGEDLQRLNADWAVWDDTYQFLQDQNEDYIASNILLDTFENIDINLMLYIDNNENVIFSDGYNLEDGTPLELEGSFPSIPKLLEAINEQNGRLILYQEPFGYLMLVSEPILTSEGEGPSAGSLIMGKVLNDNFFDKMRNELAVDVRTLNIEEEGGSLPVLNNENDQVLVERMDIGDGLFLEIKREAEYYKEKLGSMNDLFLTLSLTTLLLTFLVYYLLDFFVLSRISYLSIQLKDVDFEKPLSLNVRNSKTAKDEITDLEKSVQGMLESLEKAHSEVSKLAYYDQLTSLPNRFNLYKEFEKKANEEDASFAILFFDLDGFKRVNDLYGHSNGDELLKQIGLRFIDNANHRGSVLFRIGGDEFILLTDYKERSELVEEIELLMGEIRREFILSKAKAMISSSVGVSFYPTDGKTLDDLLQYADSAMYEAKQTGKNNYIFYQEMTGKQLYKYYLTLKNDLMSAVSLDQLYLEYQPIMDSSGNHIQGIEALVRWNHPEHGVIMPLHFIPLAEEIGVIRELGEWVIRKAIKDAGEWNRRYNEALKVAVNVSKFQLKSKNELFTVIDSSLKENGFPAELLQIEITESDTVTEYEEIAIFIKELKARGICVALDDFGVGASSLFNLVKLNVDIVKIDRSFLQKVPENEKDTILLKGIYGILHDLGIEVVTEGIETIHQLEFVTAKNLSSLQGYYFSEPIPLNKLIELKDILHESSL
ncbi:diguanylate cyclase (GGDEF)-like protein [Planomicrobium stackebrandtii]|uniref:Diguanylate cyclase (GGDEF)-like protein n=1 Tax=Planomicrobium stackebrandtii TaxID=253160 RepID=A0ABU0GVU7_9BACL|nr:EAL domain-containing protein [Planomicrobium stackebrandtii]MDQ0429497.1 diguanylate cyclase (GGDEF)-like protein [Planomicrobium stackebrandtii]